MVREIRIYIEGGGDKNGTKRPLSEGLSKFFRELINEGKKRHIRIEFVLCGNRDETFKSFKMARKSYSEADVFLLVDADHPVSTSPLEHVEKHHGWAMAGIAENRCHLMVQIMESWFLADPDALKKFYGEKFHSGGLPSSHDVELHDKSKVLQSLKHAIRNTHRPRYEKIQHAAAVLEHLQPSKVRASSKNCERLFRTLEELIKS